MKNWKINETIKKENLQEYYWYQGFFHFDFGKNDIYRRDFEELRYRDLALFSLGKIEEKRIIDIGCGSGLYALTFLKLGATFVSGQDISQASIDIANEKSKKNGYTNFDYKVGNCEKLLFDDNSFDLAFSGDVFEHITKQQKINFINEIFRVLKPGGILTIKTPNKDYLKMSIALKRIKALLMLKNPFNIYIAHTKNNPDNEHHGLTTYKEMKNIFETTMFHKPTITFNELNKSGIPLFIRKLFKKSQYFNQQIIITVRKPLFYGIYG